MEGLIGFALVVYWLGSALLCAYVAEEKGYGVIAWFLIGLFLGFVGLLALGALPDKKQKAAIVELAERAHNEALKK